MKKREISDGSVACFSAICEERSRNVRGKFQENSSDKKDEAKEMTNLLWERASFLGFFNTSNRDFGI